MVDRGKDLGHGPEVQTGSVSVTTERGSDRFFVRAAAAVIASGVAISLAGPVGERVGRGLFAVVAQEPSELMIRAWGNIGSGLGLVTALVVSGIGLYRVFKRQ